MQIIVVLRWKLFVRTIILHKVKIRVCNVPNLDGDIFAFTRTQGKIEVEASHGNKINLSLPGPVMSPTNNESYRDVILYPFNFYP